LIKHVGIMGGTFNPIHLGHLIVAQEALAEYGFDRIIFVPNQIPPHRVDKKDLAGPGDRHMMVSLATASNPHFFASRVEIDRNEVSYTLDTLKILEEEHPEAQFSFITGVDSIMKDHWHGFGELLKLLKHFIAATRPGFDERLLAERMQHWSVAGAEKIRIQKIPGVDISSTLIRKRIKEGKPIKYMVTPEVESYIYKNHLYEYGTAGPTPAFEKKCINRATGDD